MFSLLLQGGKILFIVLSYLFLAWVVFAISRDLAPRRVEEDQPARGRLVVVSSPALQPGLSFPLDKETVVGRSPDSDVIIGDNHASSRHARIQRSGTAFVIEDLGSTNGTYVNKERISEVRVLSHGEEITVGKTTFRFEEE